MNRILPRLSRWAVVLVLLLLAVAFVASRGERQTEITVHFASSAGLYVGDDVKVIGIPVGTVTSITPRSDGVEVTIAVDGDQPIPADASAAIVAPSLVSGRFVQLAPAYEDGPQLDDGAEIPMERSAVPVSFDEVKQQLTDLSTALGPDGPTSDAGALAEAITTIDANLQTGNADRLLASIEAMRSAADALSTGRSDLFQTVEHLNTFTESLVENDAAVQGFVTEFADATELLDSQREQIATVITELDTTLTVVSTFVDDNRTELGAAVSEMGELTATLAERSNTLAGLLHSAPHSVTGLYNVIENNAVTGRATLANLDSASQLLCGALVGVGGTAEQCGEAVGPLLDLLGLASVPGSPGSAGQPHSTPVVPPAVTLDPDPTPTVLTDLLSTLISGGQS